MEQVKVYGNDAIDIGVITITFNKEAPVSPLHLDFKRDDGLECSISLTHKSVKELLKLIVNNL